MATAMPMPGQMMYSGGQQMPMQQPMMMMMVCVPSDGSQGMQAMLPQQCMMQAPTDMQQHGDFGAGPQAFYQSGDGSGHGMGGQGMQMVVPGNLWQQDGQMMQQQQQPQQQPQQPQQPQSQTGVELKFLKKAFLPDIGLPVGLKHLERKISIMIEDLLTGPWHDAFRKKIQDESGRIQQDRGRGAGTSTSLASAVAAASPTDVLPSSSASTSRGRDSRGRGGGRSCGCEMADAIEATAPCVRDQGRRHEPMFEVALPPPKCARHAPRTAAPAGNGLERYFKLRQDPQQQQEPADDACTAPEDGHLLRVLTSSAKHQP
eukprot:gnl/TRDRNA2_/TRDRNA2_152984_c4_seq2.p1 gnl/TRDRNA2_/TRDRNA2_152984_c4~~gnl/TRDRNA2_/TRDRNA2_152984_c4_seq2.p1  ORF type:complete len:317 (+),score=65.54 gnl/TRDRNA2_/TRDRNA2_152984_c4_seq2:87-1037(+)